MRERTEEEDTRSSEWYTGAGICIRNHPIASVSVIFALSIIVLIIMISRYLWVFIQNQPTAFATLILALVAVTAIIKDPLSESFNRPIIKVVPKNPIEYPKNKDNEISIFAVERPDGSPPMYIWVRIYLRNEGRTVARDVYAKLVSIAKVEDKNKSKTNIRLKPFNPFKLRWVSSDNVIEYRGRWNRSIISGNAIKKSRSGDLVREEFEYLNLCTFVGGYTKDNGSYSLPRLVPGLPEWDSHGNIVGEGQVAGMNKKILEITVKTESVNGEEKSKWDEVHFEYRVIIGGSNFRTQNCTFYLTCKPNETLCIQQKESTKG